MCQQTILKVVSGKWFGFNFCCDRSKDVTVVSDSKKVLTSQDKTRRTPRKERRGAVFQSNNLYCVPSVQYTFRG